MHTHDVCAHECTLVGAKHQQRPAALGLQRLVLRVLDHGGQHGHDAAFFAHEAQVLLCICII